MKVLVLGNSGQLACSLAQLASEFETLELEFFGRAQLDLAEAAAIEGFCAAHSSPHWAGVINTAAFTQVDFAETQSELAEQINHLAVARLAQWASAQGLFWLQISTDYVFDGQASAPYVESDHPAPLNAYGLSKWRGEQAVLASGCTGWIVRTSALYSEFGQNFAKSILTAAQAGKPLRVVDDQITSPTYALDLARAVLRLLTAQTAERNHLSPHMQILHFANAGQTSWHDFACEILRLAGQSADVTPVSTQAYRADKPWLAQRPAYAVLDSGKMARLLGKQSRSWQAALAECLARV